MAARVVCDAHTEPEPNTVHSQFAILPTNWYGRTYSPYKMWYATLRRCISIIWLNSLCPGKQHLSAAEVQPPFWPYTATFEDMRVIVSVPLTRGICPNLFQEFALCPARWIKQCLDKWLTPPHLWQTISLCRSLVERESTPRCSECGSHNQSCRRQNVHHYCSGWLYSWLTPSASIREEFQAVSWRAQPTLLQMYSQVHSQTLHRTRLTACRGLLSRHWQMPLNSIA